MIVVVHSCQRSGTHFLIDSLVNNFEKCVFPDIRPSFSSLENLLLTHDRKVTEMWLDYIFGPGDPDEIRIVKTHLLPEEIEAALELEGYVISEGDRRVLEFMLNDAKKVYVRRNVRDVMVSLYHYQKGGGGLHNSMERRIEQMDFAEFLRTPNHHIMPSRAFADFDRNPVANWCHHVTVCPPRAALTVRFEDLKGGFAEVMADIAAALEIESQMAGEVRMPLMANRERTLYERVRDKILKKLGKAPRTTTVMPRKGVVGDYRNYFSPEDEAFTDAVLAEYGVSEISPGDAGSK